MEVRRGGRGGGLGGEKEPKRKRGRSTSVLFRTVVLQLSSVGRLRASNFELTLPPPHSGNANGGRRPSSLWGVCDIGNGSFPPSRFCSSGGKVEVPLSYRAKKALAGGKVSKNALFSEGEPKKEWSGDLTCKESPHPLQRSREREEGRPGGCTYLGSFLPSQEAVKPIRWDGDFRSLSANQPPCPLDPLRKL